MTREMERAQVVIAGAGPVGCVAATYLAKHGIDVILAETGLDAAQDLRASTFHSPTLEMLDTLGVAQDLIDMGLKAPVYHWRDRQTGEVLSFDLAEISDVTRFPFRVQCEQYHLARTLSSRLTEQAKARVMFGHRVIHFEQDDQGVTVSLEHVTGITKVRADYLIGADGANSLVRKWLGIEFDGFTYPEHFLCLSTKQRIDDEIPNLAYVNYVSDPKEWLVLLRVPSVWRVLVPASAEDDPAWLLSDEKKNAVFGGLVADGEAVKTEHRTIYRVHQRVAKSFHHGRVLLMGDSAHLNNPLGGFGMNSGIHDAFNGCEKLVQVIKGEAGPDLLERYDRQRRTVTHDFTQQQTIANMAIMRGEKGEAHQRKLDAMRTLVTDDTLRREYLLKQSMFTSLAEAEAIA
jgi:3-(3-hydroxy-phenyl)propionate hydroxylase